MIVISFAGLLVIGLGYVSSLLGRYGYKKWKHRASTQSIEESKARGVFIREVHYRVDSFNGPLGKFKPYIEQGLRYGRHSSKQTMPLELTSYPYQLSFSYRPMGNVTILIKSEDLKKFDSANNSWGYLRSP